jgi:hypothetical protein
VYNIYLNLGMNKSGIAHTLLSGSHTVHQPMPLGYPAFLKLVTFLTSVAPSPTKDLSLLGRPTHPITRPLHSSQPPLL